MESKNLIILEPLDEMSEKAYKSLSDNKEFNLHKIETTQFEDTSILDWFPCVAYSSDYTASVQFLTCFDKMISETSSKFLFYPKTKITEKQRMLLKALKVTEVIEDPKLTHKTIEHKLKLQAKTLGYVVTAEQQDLKLKYLDALKKDQEKQRPKNDEMDYETVNYLAITQFCNNSLKTLNALELEVEKIEEELTSDVIQSVQMQFERMQNDAEENNLEIIALFVQIQAIVCRKIFETDDDTFTPVLIGIIFSAIDLLRKEFNDIKERKAKKQIVDNPHSKLFSRYNWLSEKIIERDKDDSIHKLMEQIGILNVTEKSKAS